MVSANMLLTMEYWDMIGARNNIMLKLHELIIVGDHLMWFALRTDTADAMRKQIAKTGSEI